MKAELAGHMQSETLSLDATLQRIATLVRGMMNFWKSAQGWAPVKAAGLLNKSMLEWQSSLADCLQIWNHPLSDGELILAWANIGSLVEGQLKLFLSIYYEDYIVDVNAIKSEHGDLIDPDVLFLEKLRVIFKKNIWKPSEPWDDWISKIQQRRNAIHAYKFREIGTTEELHRNLMRLLEFVRMINSRLPYPDEIYVPREF